MTALGNLNANGNTVSSVTVNGVGATVYQDFTYATTNGVPLSNGANTFTATAVDSYGRSESQVTAVNLPTSTSLQYDLNGNLIYDGLRRFVYDSADRLRAVYVTNVWTVELAYDALSRLRIKKEYSHAGSLTNEVRYVYWGRQVLEERGPANIRSVLYTRGLDLSGSWEGAGGIGGLLARTANSSSAFYHNDVAGNITSLVNSQGQLQARYLYDSFGNLMARSGLLADANVYRFSSKELLPNAGLYYYGFRLYEPNLQRWLNRDPIGIAGGLNVHGFVGNNPVSRVDPLGLAYAYYSSAQDLASVATDGVPGPLPYIKSEGWANDHWYDYLIGPANNLLSTVLNTANLIGEATEDVAGTWGFSPPEAELLGEFAEVASLFALGELTKVCPKRIAPAAEAEAPAAKTTGAESAFQYQQLKATLSLQEQLGAGKIVTSDALELGQTRVAVYDLQGGKIYVGNQGSAMHIGVVDQYVLTPGDNLLGGFIKVCNNGKLGFDPTSGSFPLSTFNGTLDNVRGTGISIIGTGR